jgi:hypothetical protein
MKNFILTLTLLSLIACQTVVAQFKDVQLHYELGSFKRGENTIKRNFFKTKVQILQRDSSGFTYLNAEVDYNNPQTKGMSFGQLTLLRSLKVPFLKYVQPTIGHAAILGASNYYFAGVLVPAKFGRVVVLPLLLYSYNRASSSADARVMIGVSTKLAKKRIQIFGFASAWTYDNNVLGEVKGKKVAWQFTPQIWFHATKAFAVGTKIDYSRNLYSADKTNDFLPTTGVRWVF